MPKREVGIISHSALTNHRIIARFGEPLPAAAFQQTAPDLPDLIVLDRRGQKKPPPIVLLQSYGELMGQAPQYRERYLALLAELAESLPNDPVVQAALGQKAFLESDAKAIAHLSKAIELGFTSATVYENLAEALVRGGRTPEAIEVLRKGVDVLPYAPRLHKFLAARYIDLKQYDQAKQAMERYIDLFPDDDFVRGLLRNVSR
jgi:tetratricopeptide (TPR) repeat protein